MPAKPEEVETEVEETEDDPEAAKAAVKGLIREALDDWFKDNAPSPKRTDAKQTTPFDLLFGKRSK